MKLLNTPWARFLIDNVGWFAISLGLAATIWVVAQNEVNPVEEEQLPGVVTIEYIAPADDNLALLRTTNLRTTARVTVRAPRRTIDEIETADLRVVADLRNLDEGTHRVELSGEIVEDGLPGRVVEISPADINIEVVQVFMREDVPIRVDTPSDLLAQGFELRAVQCAQETIAVTGPLTVINRVARGVVRVNLQSNDTTSFTQSYAIEPRYEDDSTLSQNDLRNVQITPASIDCAVLLAPIEGRQLPVQPQFVGELPEGYDQSDFSVDPPTVFVTGDTEIVDGLADSISTASIDLSGQTTDFSREVGLAVATGLITQPETVTVTIRVTPRISDLEFTNVPVRVDNMGAAFTSTSVVPETIDIIVEGPEPLINALTIDDFRVLVNVEGRGAGTYTDLPLTTEILREVDQSQLTVTTLPQNVSVVISMAPTPTALPIRIWGG